MATTILTGYSIAELCQAQLEDPNIGEVLQAKQGNCRQSVEHAKSQSGVSQASSTVGAAISDGWSSVVTLHTAKREPRVDTACCP